MKRLVMILLMGLFCMINSSYAGNGDLTVGGALEMTSSANGFLPPRITTSARGNLTPSPGMLIYNTDDNAYNYYTSSGWKILGASLPVHDNTGASVDYALAVGETAYINYSNASSVPLHIDCTGGIKYEITIIGDRTVSILNNSYASLRPNNTTYTNAMSYTQKWRGVSSDSGNGGNGNQSALILGESRASHCEITVITTTKSKTLISTDILEGSDGSIFEEWFTAIWNNTTTAWTSLGTVVFPFNQTGTIFIRRIL